MALPILKITDELPLYSFFPLRFAIHAHQRDSSCPGYPYRGKGFVFAYRVPNYVHSSKILHEPLHE